MHNVTRIQQYAAPCQALQIIREFIRDQSSETFYCPSNRPDLSPIETVWSIVKHREYKRQTIGRND